MTSATDASTNGIPTTHPAHAPKPTAKMHETDTSKNGSKIKTIRYQVLNPDRGGVIIKTIKSNYYKQGLTNFLLPRFPSHSAPAILIEYDEGDSLIHPNHPISP